ncbi:MAG: TetR/AcrR family transcriptional regulator [Acidobacteria bacterium]|nr:TetR/AcrR family transcriptional regulator [Acidobacteriota bacterium]
MRRQDPARRRKILQAARRRLEHYGYEKTTMAEIASDAGMAVGTLYQYFKNKEDLIVAFGEECQNRYLDALERISGSKLPPLARLRELIRLRVLEIKRQMEATPHGGEILLRMMQSGHACCQKMHDRERQMTEEVLREGVRRGEFNVADPLETARAFESAFSGFMPPASLGRSRHELESEIDALFNLLLNGLRNTNAPLNTDPRDRTSHPGAAR